MKQKFTRSYFTALTKCMIISFRKAFSISYINIIFISRGTCKANQVTPFKPNIEEYKSKYQRKGFHEAVNEAEHHPGVVPPEPEEYSSESDETDEDGSEPKPKRKRRPFKDGKALRRCLYTDREYFFGNPNTI